jgi:serine/threonine-protein kinase
MARIRVGQRVGKYRIRRRLGEGGFAAVYSALDTVEGVPVALKVPHERLVTGEVMEDFRREVRLAARLDHPNVLPIKNADVIDGRFVIATPLGEGTLADRLQSRLALPAALELADQMLGAVAYAHSQRIIHCDVKPDNLIVFPGPRLRLADFGIARVALRTVRASGSGTVGYVAPEQAVGKPSFRSDVFSLGLVLFRMLAGRLPEWPYAWPPPGAERLRGRVHPDLVALVRRAIELDPRRRFRDAEQMLAAFRRIRPRAARARGRAPRRRAGRPTRDWRTVRHRQFRRQFGRALETRFRCRRCDGPVSESMRACPWCGRARRTHDGDTRFPRRCPRCDRGMKLDWRYCPWCYGPGFEVATNREYRDRRYEASCSNPSCPRGELMPFMRYCPWCRRKVRRKWKVPGSGEKCASCGWGMLDAYWDHCPWCGKRRKGR